ncbi:MAG: hormogonium polysaccharide biosynthesis protein HpsA [Jaaginema sp. PMC 1079.18]|nr:hormogonium polysaccharide biosynthesis protein HpsA [Jaaginema sp. PMC 1080.18]MEC4850541.1 hormogonium polysaccharide biosynthesis protein HpsA [Jaaginema sp. PMC 1079.18]MEC4867667.1 hormogonium polysaccharide biosynthesis protein HpsA [Jaaginema sp. PMC 1078.18]
MSQRRQPPKHSRHPLAQLRSFLQSLNRLIGKVFSSIKQRVFVLGRERPSATAGFVLPTVIMVMLVVTLLTLTIVFRSFDRARNAGNVRISQATLEAASPAVERATAKLDTLFGDPRLPRSTPSDTALYTLLSDPRNDDKFTFDDEMRVELAYDFGNGNGGPPGGGINTGGVLPLERDEVITTAWKYPVDTDNNGKYDSFTIYSILFRTPEQSPNGNLARERSPIEARTRPMDDGSGSGFCAAALNTSAKLVSQGGWFKSGSKLKKSFFVYTATVPITNTNQAGLISAANGGSSNNNNVNQTRPRLTAAQQIGNYETKGDTGFTALEYQQDRARIPLGNFAVVFEDDLAVVSSTPLYLNGSIIANSNFFLAPANNTSNTVKLYQVSAPISCFYQEENSEVFVGGHIVNSPPANASASGGSDVPIHLYTPSTAPKQNEKLTNNNQSAVSGESPRRIVYNSFAHTARINRLVSQWTANNSDNGAQVYTNTDPQDVRDAVSDFNGSTSEKSVKRQEALFNYFKNRTRKVPFDEELQINPASMTTLTGNYQGTGETLRPPNTWIFPYNPADGKSSPNSYARIDLNTPGNKVNPPATEPRTQRQDDEETYIGDRIAVGNNLPAIWYNNNNPPQPVAEEEIQEISGTVWDRDTTDPFNTPRGRYTQVKILSDVGDKSRGGFWEVAAATQPENPLGGTGGLRIITGAGVYERKSSFLPPPKPANPNATVPTTYDDPGTTAQERFPVVWPDTMPMSPVPGSKVYDNQPGSTTEGQWVDLAAYNDATRNAPPNSIDPATRKYAKGDLKMRASAVYHYAQNVYDPDNNKNWQPPIACVSSYYDPSSELSAQNTSGLPDVSPLQDATTKPNPNPGVDNVYGSNNGIVYGINATAQSVAGANPDANTGLFPGDENRTDLNGQLYHQANLVYPNGRFVNEPLRKALIARAQSPNNISLAAQAAIESTICSLQILNNQVGRNSSLIGDGWIQEIAFLDSKEIRGLQAAGDRSSLKSSADVDSVNNSYNSTSNDYNLPIEERQPSEVRATAIDLDQFRRKQIGFNGSIGSTSPTPEFLLPNSGIIYASREDALPDITAASGNTATPSEVKNSAVDYKLDPTRRSNGIMVYNGLRLGRNNANSFNTVTPGEAEKGLILVTNNPAYVWANQTKNGGGVSANNPFAFNTHTQEEFTAPLDLNPNNPWTNFYSRGNTLGQENPNFACRQNDPRLPACTTGDQWRPATIISDAIAFLSGNFRFGYRNEGDFDLRNNQDSYYENSYNYTNAGSITKAARQKRYLTGFLDNNYVTNGLSSLYNPNNQGLAVNNQRPRDDTYTSNSTRGEYIPSSYFNNFVTPVQRRRRTREYLMEVCPKLPVSECGANDWYVNYDSATPANNKRVSDGGVVSGTFPNDYVTTGTVANRFNAGTTARPPAANLQRFPRRVAFQRNSGGQLVLREINDNQNINTTQQTLVPLGIKAGKIIPYPYNRPGEAEIPDEQDNALWFVHPNDANQPWNLNNVNPNASNRLAYLEYKPASEREELRLPDVLALTQAQMTSIADVSNRNRLKTAFENLNGYSFDTNPLPTAIGYDDPADYLFCIGGTSATGQGIMRRYTNIGKLQDTNCNKLTNIENARTALASLTTTNTVLTNTTQELTASTQLNVYQLPVANTGTAKPANLLEGITLTLKRGNIENPVFVFQAQDIPLVSGSPADPIVFKNFTLKLDGVNPNNIFWVSKSGVQFDKSTGNNLLAGNFLGKSDAIAENSLNPNVGGSTNTANKTEIKGGRFLGFSGSFTNPLSDYPSSVFNRLNNRDFNDSSIGGGTYYEPNFYVEGTSYADFHPLLVPVLQIQSTQGTSYGKGNPNGDGNNVNDTHWLPIAGSSEYNIVFAAGNSPARPGEPDGGIANFANLIEGWDGVNYRINGSQMEFERSSFATSPYRPMILTYNDNQSKGGPFNFNQSYKTGNLGGRVPYTGVPNRLFGYDVGLLSQTPDLFSSRFTAPSPGEPDEFFREVGRNDDWVQTLLCAKNAITGQNAINTDQRPQNFCNRKSKP